VTGDDLPWWPAANACLNATSTILLVTGWRRIRRRDVEGHRRAMLGAVAVSCTFLVSYLVFHSIVGTTRYPEVGAVKTVYLAILLSHTVLAGLLAILVPRTVFLGLKGRFAEHVRIARWTFPIWLYVSVTGVVVYLLLYPFRPEAPPA
jgi:uncharacterized membrane protein YozB (DUF420 family)